MSARTRAPQLEKKQPVPNIDFITLYGADSDDILWERARLALPQVIRDLARQAGEIAWSDTPGGLDLSLGDRARLVRETSEAYQRNLTQRETSDICEQVHRLLRAKRDALLRG